MTTRTLTTSPLAEVGELLEPLFTWRGKSVYPIFGGAPDGDDVDDQDGEPGGDGSDDGEGKDEGTKSGEQPVSREEFERLQAQLSAADRKRNEAEKRLKAIADKDKDELTKATERVEELTKTTEAQAKENANLRLQNAFLTVNGIKWADPEDALALAERGGYLEGLVGEDGKVDGKKLKSKLEALATAKPHLVVKDGTDNTPPPSGGNVGGSSKSKKDGEPDLSRYKNRLGV